MAVIDDFGDVPHEVTLLSGVESNHQTGTMLGGGRYTGLIVGLNPRNQPAHLDTGTGYLNLSVGAEQYLRLEVGYGVAPASTLVESGSGDFLALGNVFRTRFRFSDNMIINFNIVVFTETGWVSYGENIGVAPFSPRNIDFPFDKFVGFGPSPADFSKVGAIVYVFQSWADFVIDSFEIV